MPTKIEWTDESWNPIIGCSKISDGCKNCYAEKMAYRLACVETKNTLNGFDYIKTIDLKTRQWEGKTILREKELIRPFKKEWIESIYMQCKEAGIPFFDKKNILGLNLKQFPA